MPTPHCPRCYAKELADIKKRHGDDPTISLDVNEMNFACKVPIYESDGFGRPIVRIWDCESKRTLTYSQEEFERKRGAGEI